jgi:hypothetical protein
MQIRFLRCQTVGISNIWCIKVGWTRARVMLGALRGGLVKTYVDLGARHIVLPWPYLLTCGYYNKVVVVIFRSYSTFFIVLTCRSLA